MFFKSKCPSEKRKNESDFIVKKKKLQRRAEIMMILKNDSYN